MRSNQMVFFPVLVFLGACSAAGGEHSDDGEAADPGGEVVVTELDAPRELPTWDEFLREATHVAADGTTYYMVEWDYPIRTEAELSEYYYQRVTGSAEKGVAHQFNNADDIWTNGDQLRIRYCVDTHPTSGFDAAPVGVTSATIIASMAAATAAWERVANIKYFYDAANNGTCRVSDPVPDTRYIKISRADFLPTVCAFGPQSRSAWTCTGLDGSTIGVLSTYTYPGQAVTDWAGVMMHELGHTLGLHHEHFHTVGGGCSVPDTRNVTATADLVSVMGYPAGSEGCALTNPSLSALSLGDGWTVRTFYGMPASWYTGMAGLK